MTPRVQRLLHDSLLFSAALAPGKTAVIVEGEPHTYGELLEKSRRLAQSLRALGVTRGDRVAIYMDNTWPCVVSIFAVLLAGGAFLIVNPQTKADKLRYILDDSDAAVLFTDAHLAANLNPILSRLSKLKAVISSGEPSAILDRGNARVWPFDGMLAASTPVAEAAKVIPNDLAALIYTSGSTGNPKGVMQTHQSMVFAAGSLIEYQRLSENHRILNVLPLAFDYGLYQLLMAIRLGATLVLERSFTYPAQVLKRISDHEVTVFPGVPTIFSMLLSSHGRKPLRLPSVTRVTNTAAALPSGYVASLREIFPNALIYSMYGLTECKRVSYLEPELIEHKPRSVGKAIPGTEVFLLSPNGEPVPPGEVGILHVRGPHIMLGYWKQPELSSHMLKEGRLSGERVLCTHDWFRMDEEGFLYFVGRSDDIIKTHGEKVSPIEVENVLYGISGIREAAVVGVTDELLGQAIRAYISLDDGVTLSEKDIKRICVSRLENFMVPRDIVFLPELPKTASGKISKNRLRDFRGHAQYRDNATT